MIRRASVACLVAALAGCGVSGKKAVLSTALDPHGQRDQYLEATLRVLDEHPEYVDELFVKAKKHPKTLDRFLEAAARDLHEDELAKLTAAHLVRHPDGLERILVRTMDAAKDDPAARAAIAKAIEERSDVATDVITDNPAAVKASLAGTVDHIADKPESRVAFLVAMQDESPELARMLAHNPKTLRVILKAFLEVGIQGSKSLGADLMKELGVKL